MSRVYRHARPRGMAPWEPRLETLVLLERVRNVLDEFAEHLPLTCRQIFYRLVGAHGYPKDERAYERLTEKLVRARRSGRIPFDAIRDDGVVVEEPVAFEDVADFWESVVSWARGFRLDRQAEQVRFVEVWVEAAGMVPQIERVASDYGVPVYSSGGFDSVSTKRDAADRIIKRGEQITTVLHVGDHDPSGLSVFDAAAADVQRFVCDLDGEELPEFERIVVTPAQIAKYELETAPPKKTDKRGDWQGGTVQAEALPPDVLAAEVKSAIEGHLDLDQWRRTLALEAEERDALVAQAEAMT